MSLDKIYKKIPVMECKEGCSDCCEPVHFSDEEWEKVKHRPKQTENPFACDFLINDKCSIYDDRPFICRIFGTTKGIKLLKCSHGCKPRFPISAKKGWRLFDLFHNGAYQTNIKKREDPRKAILREKILEFRKKLGLSVA